MSDLAHEPLRDIAHGVSTLARTMECLAEHIQRDHRRQLDALLDLAHEIQLVPIATCDRHEMLMQRRQAIPTPVITDPGSAKIIAQHVVDAERAAVAEAVTSVGRRLISPLLVKLIAAAGGGAVLSRLIELLWR